MPGAKRRSDVTEGNARKKSKLKKLPENEAGTQNDAASDLDQDSDAPKPAAKRDSFKATKGEWRKTNGKASAGGDKFAKMTSKDTHIKQKSVAQERKLAKPNAPLIVRTKKLWERLRLKSHVPRDERKQLVAELYSIITGRVHDFIFKHDSVRVIQTALKYGIPDQRKAIALELKGAYRDLAESKYGKFLLAKLVVHGDEEIRDMIVPEFYGHVRKLMRHPEAAWILDDIYRQALTPTQKSALLREWYGPEFAIFKTPTANETSELSKILEEAPEKRAPIMQHLLELINLLVQKKTTGFTMLHDAMLQYFLNTKPGSTEASEFIELLKVDEDGNLEKNLAFTKSGARLMCLVLAYSTAKDRKLLLRMYRDTISMIAEDAHAHSILLTAYEVVDDTKLTAKLIFSELFGDMFSSSQRHEVLLQQVEHPSYRIPLLYLFGGDKLSWLLSEADKKILDEVRSIRSSTSKKDPTVRRNELISAASPTMLEFVASSAGSLVKTASGCRCITEVVLGASGDKAAAVAAVVATVNSEPEAMGTPFAGRMLKSLVQGGRYNPDLKAVEKSQPPLQFDALLYDEIKKDVLSWLVGPNPFVLVALLEADDFTKREELIKTLNTHKKELSKLTESSSKKEDEKSGAQQANRKAARLLLDAMK
ncbi:Pumilio y domain member 6 [Ophidiomyces ophidiicola]|nr:Pumilio y domain member 6 [Ophidiomyces ophidiicola]